MVKNLYVGNLSYSTTDNGLRAAFEAYGPVISANVIMDRASGRSKGFGFVEMATEEAASAAIEGLNGKMLDGRTIRVAEAKPRESGGQAGGQAGGRGGQGGERGGERGSGERSWRQSSGR